MERFCDENAPGAFCFISLYNEYTSFPIKDDRLLQYLKSVFSITVPFLSSISRSGIFLNFEKRTFYLEPRYVRCVFICKYQGRRRGGGDIKWRLPNPLFLYGFICIKYCKTGRIISLCPRLISNYFFARPNTQHPRSSRCSAQLHNCHTYIRKYMDGQGNLQRSLRAN